MHFSHNPELLLHFPDDIDHKEETLKIQIDEIQICVILMARIKTLVTAEVILLQEEIDGEHILILDELIE